MNRKLLARGRALLGCAFLATVTGAASCSTAGSTVSISGRDLSIFVSSPASLAGDSAAQDTVDAERLAYGQRSSEVNAYKLHLYVDTHASPSYNARDAIETTSTIAYLGELAPGQSANTIGITNAVDLLQISPTDTDARVTQHSSTNGYYEGYSSYGQTFARMVPSSTQEAQWLVGQMQALGVKTLYVTGDGSGYGQAIAVAVKSFAAPGITVASSPSAADGMFYGGESASAASQALDRIAAADPSVKLFVPSALDNTTFVASLSPAAQGNLYASSPGFLPGALSSAGKSFVSSFTAAYGHDPAPEAIFGYEAMSALLSVLHQAGAGANSRSTVVSDFLKLRRGSTSQSVIGPYSISKYGDLNGTAPFVLSRVKSGNLVPFR